jgi:type I restriction enzyme S subunit
VSRVVPLRRVARLIYGAALASVVREDGEYPVLGSGGRSGFHSAANAAGPAIIIGGKGSFGAIHWEGGDCFVIDTAYFVSPLSSATDLRWLYYALHAVDLKGASQDVGVPGLSRESAYEVQLPIYGTDEQRRIADFLDVETTLINGLTEQRLRQRGLLEEVTQSATDHAIAHLNSDCPKPRLGYCARVQTGVTVDGGRQQIEGWVTRPYLRVANVQVGYLDLNEVAEMSVSRTTAAASSLRSGDVLMTEGGDLDKLGRGTVWHDEIADCLHQNHVFAVRPDTDVLVPEYLALLTRASFARQYFESTGNKTTNLASTSSSKIRDFRIPVPDVSTQRSIVKQIDARAVEVEQLDSVIGRQLSLLAERRQALITAAVTGQIDVTTARGVDV